MALRSFTVPRVRPLTRPQAARAVSISRAMSRATGMSLPTTCLILPSLPMMKAVRAAMPFSGR